MAIDQLAQMGGGQGPGGQGPAEGIGQVGAQPQEKAVEALMGSLQLFRMAMQLEPGLSMFQPDVEKMSLKVAKYFGYDKEMKLAMDRAQQEMRAGGPPGGPQAGPPQGGPPGGMPPGGGGMPPGGMGPGGPPPGPPMA